jgi:hypothetical protein
MPEQDDIPAQRPAENMADNRDLQQQPVNQLENSLKYMEVHHHPDLHHKKKHWKEYILEFLMIFLAVTLGFFAETIREKISESHREKDYIRGLINNVQSDTTNLQELILANDLELKGIDSLLNISKTDLTHRAVQDSIFYYVLQYTLNLHIFTFNDLTLVQLRNAGGYSLIKTGKVADSIALYDYNNNNIILQERFFTDSYIQTWASVKGVFDGNLTGRFFLKYTATNKIPLDFGVLITKNEEKLHLLINNYWSYAITLNGYNNMLKTQLEYLKGFLRFLKRNYNLE